MKKDEHFSEEQLNAFVDGELDPEEKARIYNEAARSPEIDQRLCQQRKIKELVAHAYADVAPETRTGAVPTRSGPIGRAFAAGILIVVSLSAGFLARDYFSPAQDAAGAQATAVSEQHLLHVTSNEPEQMLAALEYARHLLESAEDGHVRQVEIIANEQGLDLLRSDITPYAGEIAALQASDVVFYACSRTIEKLVESGVSVQLVPYTNTDYTALDRVVSRMQEGWTYEKL